MVESAEGEDAQAELERVTLGLPAHLLSSCCCIWITAQRGVYVDVGVFDQRALVFLFPHAVTFLSILSIDLISLNVICRLVLQQSLHSIVHEDC